MVRDLRKRGSSWISAVGDKPLRQKLNSHLLSSADGLREIAGAEAVLDDVFIDDISFPAADRYLLGATLFLPRGAKRHAVLFNSAPPCRARSTGVLQAIWRGGAARS